MNKILFMVLLFTVLVGCAPVDLNYQFPTSMAIEYKDNKYVVSVVIPSLEENSNKSNSEKPPLVIVRGRGDTLSQALEKINLKEKGRISGVHIRSIIFHKSLFEEGNITYDTLSKYFIDSVEFRLNSLVYITNEDIDKLLTVENPLTTNAFNNLSDKTKSQYYNKYRFPTLIDTMIDYYEKRDFFLPEVYISDNAISSKDDDKVNSVGIYDISNFCYIKDDLVCIDKEKLKGLSYFHEVTANDVEYGNENEVVSGLIKKVNVNISYKKNFNMKVNVYLSISDNLKKDSKDTIKDTFEEQIKSYIVDTYNEGKLYNVDVYNIKDGYRRYKKKDIDLESKKLNVNVDVKLTNSRLI